ncbi:hypothetical protein [Trueperella pyogenes]|uniref:hypothetical protein n=1 Tax=Trueperella pyogenes TaxID=1661 RepID=UPI00345D3F5D
MRNPYKHSLGNELVDLVEDFAVPVLIAIVAGLIAGGLFFAIFSQLIPAPPQDQCPTQAPTSRVQQIDQ